MAMHALTGVGSDTEVNEDDNGSSWELTGPTNTEDVYELVCGNRRRKREGVHQRKNCHAKRGSHPKASGRSGIICADTFFCFLPRNAVPFTQTRHSTKTMLPLELAHSSLVFGKHIIEDSNGDMCLIIINTKTPPTTREK